MPAITVSGQRRFEGQVILYDIDTVGYPNAYTLGEMYFIVAENPKVVSFGTTTAIFRREYINHFVTESPWPNAEQQHYVCRDVVPQYSSVNVDRGMDAFRDLYEHTLQATEEFQKTILKYYNLEYPREKDDVIVKRGLHRGQQGYVLSTPYKQQTPHANERVTVMLNSDGSTLQTLWRNLKVLSPLSRLSGKMCCYDCGNIYDSPDNFTWVSEVQAFIGNGEGPFNRPICRYCLDGYLDNGTLDYTRRPIFENLYGPFRYGKDQPDTRIISPSVPSLHSVLLVERSRRIREGRRHTMYPYIRRRGV